MDPQNMNQPPQPQMPPESPASPQQPMQPTPQLMQPMVSVPNTGYGMPKPASGGPKKGLIIGIVAGVVGLIVVIVVALLLVSMLNVSRKDYAAAYSQYAKVSSANYTLSSKISTLQYSLSSGTDTSFDNDVDAAKSAIESVKKENEALGKLKAVKHGDGKEKYKAFSAKIDAYTAYVNDLLTSLVDARGASEKCDSTAMSSVSKLSQLKSAIDACVTALDKISSTPNADVKEFMGKLKDEYGNLSTIVGKLAAINDPYGSQYDQYSSLRDQMYDITDKISDAQTDFRSNIEKHADEVDPKDAADDLGDYLADKSIEK